MQGCRRDELKAGTSDGDEAGHTNRGPWGNRRCSSQQGAQGEAGLGKEVVNSEMGGRC